jgi:ABC transporter substrate binding protein
MISGFGMRRREFITLLGGATAAWPLETSSQQAMPVIGFLASLSSAYVTHFTPSFSAGLRETGYIDGQNVLIEFRSAEGQYDRLSALAAELVDRKVAVIVAANGSEPAKVAKAATATIPIVFVSAADPVKAGVVTSFQSTGGQHNGCEPARVGIGSQAPRTAKRNGSGGFPYSCPFESEISGCAFVAMTNKHVEAVAIIEDAVFLPNPRVIADLASKNHLPSVARTAKVVQVCMRYPGG